MSAPSFRASDPETSRDAAALASLTAPTVRQRALAALRAAGADGLTDFELAAIVGRQQTSAGVRRKELERAGLVVALIGADGRPVRRSTPSGATAIVWIASDFAAPAPLSPSGAVECEPRSGACPPPTGPSSPERAA